MKTSAFGASLLLAAMLWLVPGAAPASASAQTPEGTYQKQVFKATNLQREKHDRAAFRHAACVQRFAVRQARRMAAREEMFHQDLGPILGECGLRAVGENVAVGYPTGRSVVRVGWMHSAGHRANILNPGFRLLGVGAMRSRGGTWYAAQVFGRK